jgi:hypothetical protein
LLLHPDSLQKKFGTTTPSKQTLLSPSQVSRVPQEESDVETKALPSTAIDHQWRSQNDNQGVDEKDFNEHKTNLFAASYSRHTE